MNENNTKIITDRFKSFSAKELKRAALKQFNSEWNDSKIDKEVKRLFLHAKT